MNTVSRTITGAIIGVLGALILVSVITEEAARGVVPVGIGLFLVGVGGYIFLIPPKMISKKYIRNKKYYEYTTH